MRTLQTRLLACGILAGVVSWATDLLAGMLVPGYNFATQSGSVLTAPGAPTRPLVLVLDLLANALVIAFAVGLWRSAGRRRSLRVIAVLLLGSAVLQSVAVAFFPFHPAEAAGTVANRLNVALLAPTIAAWLLAVILGAMPFSNGFRFFSIGLVAAWLVEDVLATAGASLIFGAHPGSLVGVQERTMGYGFWAWVALLAWMQLRAPRSAARAPARSLAVSRPPSGSAGSPRHRAG